MTKLRNMITFEKWDVLGGNEKSKRHSSANGIAFIFFCNIALCSVVRWYLGNICHGSIDSCFADKQTNVFFSFFLVCVGLKAAITLYTIFAAEMVTHISWKPQAFPKHVCSNILCMMYYQKVTTVFSSVSVHELRGITLFFFLDIMYSFINMTA